MEFESIEKVLSLSGSAIALATTLYFWLVRANSERPNLSMVVLRPLKGSLVLPHEDYFPYQNLRTGEDENWIRYSFEFALINNSTMPNAAFGFSAELLDKNNQWVAAHCNPIDEKLFPISLPPQNTTRVELILYLPTTETGSTLKDRIAVASDALAPKHQVRLLVHSLGENKFEFVQSSQPVNLSIYSPQRQEKQAA